MVEAAREGIEAGKYKRKFKEAEFEGLEANKEKGENTKVSINCD
jgi:hypothetical protein